MAVISSRSFALYPESTRQAAIIDSVLGFNIATGEIDTKDADGLLSFIEQEKLNISYILETHVHADHLTAANYLKTKLGGSVPVGIGKNITLVQENVMAKYDLHPSFPTDGSQFVTSMSDILFTDGATFQIGNTTAIALHTPGHTPDSNSFIIGESLAAISPVAPPTIFSTPSPKSCSSTLNLPESMFGHDYPADPRKDPVPFATVAEQKERNKHVKDGVVKEEFTTWRKERDAQLGQPRLLHASLQVNIAGGRLPEPDAQGRAFFKTLCKALNALDVIEKVLN
ncbi:beta-lactamase-like protein [Chytridium lagenaria]|nr:beta-lactamase-like protein [Chytridium lagenaria]